MGCGESAAQSLVGQEDAATAPDGDRSNGDASVDSEVSSPPPRDAGDSATRLGPLVAYASGYAPSISIFSVDPTTGGLGSKKTVAAFGTSPSFLAVNRTATNLYAVDEVSAGRVGTYSIDASNGALTHLNDVSSQGSGPAFVSVDATGKFVLVANYTDGTIAVLAVQAGGRLSATPADSRLAGANAHMIVTDPSNQFVFVPCLGSDYVAQYLFDAASGKLTPNAVPTVPTASGAGPRHIAFHPSGTYAYLINEKNSTMTAYSLAAATGRLTEIETKSTLPSGFSGSNSGAEVWVHPSGKFVYGSNRGNDSIVVFAIDGATGKMTLVGHTRTGGATPRDFTLDPTGGFLYAANQNSNDIVPFAIDSTQGTLSSTASSVPVTSPSFIAVVRLPAP
jgi:6-phosphogluconolactonase